MTRPIGGYITRANREPTANSAIGIWTLEDVLQYRRAGKWPPFVAPAPAAPTFVGATVIDKNASVNYSTLNAQTGDLAIAIQHGFAGYTPTGYTAAFTTSGDTYGYLRRVSYRVLQSGDTSVQVNNDTIGFSSSLVILRGPTSVSSTYAWDYTTSGSKTLSVAVTGALVAIAADRGATVGSFPTISLASGTFDNSTTGQGTYFSERNSTELTYTSGTNITFTDYADAYGSSFLAIVAT